VPPLTGFSSRVRLPRDYYVRVASNDYSVNPQAIGRFVEVHADLDPLRGTGCRDSPAVLGRGQTITDPAHVETARVQRRAFQSAAAAGLDAALRDLAEYERAFGVVFEDGQALP
jgi:hypothetical protein